MEFGQGQDTLFARPAVVSKQVIGLDTPCVCVTVSMFSNGKPIVEQDLCEVVIKEVHQIIQSVLEGNKGIEYELGVSVRGIPVHSGFDSFIFHFYF